MSAKVELIAEIGQAHEGSLGIAHSLIDVSAELGVDAVKFQTHIAEAESSLDEPFRVKFSYQDKTRYDYWKRMEFTREQWAGLKAHCEQVGVEFISSPFSIAAVELLEQLNVKRYKIGSGEINNYLLLDRVGRTGKPVVLSSGMSSIQELRSAINFLGAYTNPISLLQCTTAYPTKPEQWGLNMIAELKNEFNVPVGFSDHSGDIYACLAAVTLGASLLEFHITFDKGMFGPDTPASLTPAQIKALVRGVQHISHALSNPVEKIGSDDFAELKIMFGKSLAINKNLKAGHVLILSDLESKKPANKGISASEFKDVIGRALNKDMDAYSFLTKHDLR